MPELSAKEKKLIALALSILAEEYERYGTSSNWIKNDPATAVHFSERSLACKALATLIEG